MNKIIILFLFFIVILPTGCLTNSENKENEIMKVEIITIEKYNKLNYHIYYIDNGYIEYIETDNTRDMSIFEFKVSNNSEYQLFINENDVFNTNFILHIPISDMN